MLIVRVFDGFDFGVAGPNGPVFTPMGRGEIEVLFATRPRQRSPLKSSREIFARVVRPDRNGWQYWR